MIEDVMCLEPLDELIMLTLLWTLGQNDPCSLYIYIKNRIFFHITAFKMSFTPISNKIDYLTTYSELWTFYSISPHLWYSYQFDLPTTGWWYVNEDCYYFIIIKYY